MAEPVRRIGLAKDQAAGYIGNGYDFSGTPDDCLNTIGFAMAKIETESVPFPSNF